MSSTLNCPACGAPAPSAVAAQCDYCGSTLTRSACASCFGPVFVGMEFCPHCGAKATRAVDDAAVAMSCPGCHAEMRSVQVGTTQLRECTACASTWLGTETFTQLCLNREERGAVATMVGSEKTQAATSVSAPVRYVPCPVCKKIMNRQNFGRTSGVVIDLCKGHGVWFEHRELQSVLAYIDNGGFDRARHLEDQRRDEERRKLEREFIESGRVVAANLQVDMQREHRHRTDDSPLDEALRMLFS